MDGPPPAASDQNDSVATNGPEIGARAAASAPDSTSQVSNASRSWLSSASQTCVWNGGRLYGGPLPFFLNIWNSRSSFWVCGDGAAAAAKLIESVGANGFSLRRLAKALGVGPTTIHFHS